MPAMRSYCSGISLQSGVHFLPSVLATVQLHGAMHIQSSEEIMTGKSIPTKENWNKLKPYYTKLLSGALIVCGSFLMLEHLFMFEGFDLLDWIGHEYYGLGMIIIGFLLSMKWSQWRELKLWNWRNWFR